MVSTSRLCWPVALAILPALLGGPSCRRQRFPSRGDTAAVVVVAPRNDAAPSPTVLEQEPNDIAAQAQLLPINPEWPLLTVEGDLSPLAKGGDVDLFKLLVPGEPAPPVPVDSGRAAEDPRMHARRFSVEVTTEGTVGLFAQLLDQGGKLMEGITVDVAATAGMPNLAVLPAQTYYVRIRRDGHAVKGAKDLVCKYRLAVQLGDFDLADEREPNDTRELANPIAAIGGGEWSGYYGWPHDQDFFRVTRPEVLSAMDVDLDAVEGVGPSLQVVDDAGGRLASARGRRGERLALRNVVLRPASPDAGPASRCVYLVVRAETGSNRARRYVLHVTMGAPQANVEVEPNDSPVAAMPVGDGTITGYLPVGDGDFFRYEGQGARDLTVEVTFPARVRGKLVAFRPGSAEPLASAEAKKPKQTLTLAAIATLGQPVVLHISAHKGDGNANDPYTLRIASTPSPPAPSATVPSVPAPPP